MTKSGGHGLGGFAAHKQDGKPFDKSTGELLVSDKIMAKTSSALVW